MASLSYANASSGVMAGAIGWINFGSLSLAPGATLTNQTATFRDGSILKFDISNTAVSGGGRTVVATAEPIYSLQSFGVVGYTGIAGNICPYASSLAGSTRVTLSNISVVSPTGATIPYSVYSADGEATGAGSSESIVFNTNGTSWSQLTLLGPGTNPTIAGIGSNTVTLTGINDVSYRTPVLASNNPTTISATLASNGGSQGAVFGVSINKISLNKVITNRFDPTDQFTLNISGAGSVSTTTFGSTYGAQPISAYLYPTAPATFTLNESMAPGSASSLNQYTQRISYANLTPGGTTVPSSTTIPGIITINPGDMVTATITNTPIVPTLTVAKQAISYQNVNSIIPYTITFTNNGVVSINNVILKDTIPSGTTLVPNSLYLNGQLLSGSPAPPTGVNLGTIPAGGVFTVTFNVLVTTTIPTPNPVKNNATSTFSYDLYPSTGSGSANSNSVTTSINDVILTSTKQVSKTISQLGDTLTYTVTFKNTGNATANNLVFTDTLPTGTTLIANSLKVNGTVISGVNPNPPGFPITIPVSTLNPNSIITINFNVTITSIPNSGALVNSADLAYTYTMTTIVNGVSGRTTTNTVTTNTLISPVKTVDISNTFLGDILTYTIVLQNALPMSLSNVILKDTIPGGTTFIPNSLTIDGVTQSGAVIAPPTGFAVGTMAPGTTATVTFQVTVVSIPSTNPTPNSATSTFSYFTTTTVAASGNSNIVSTTITDVILSSTKSVNRTNGFVGDILTYTIVLNNTGNATANNVIFVDTIPTGTSFISNSFAINGTIQPGVSPTPPGTSISNIGPGATETITFNVTVDTIPNPNPTTNTSTTGFNFISNPSTGAISSKTVNSNTVSTFVNPDNNPLKIVSKTSASVGDVLTYTVIYLNNSTVTLTSVALLDTIPTGTTFVPGSATINGSSASGTVTPPSGLALPDLPPNAGVTVTFNVTVTTLPTINPIPNIAVISHTDSGATLPKYDLSNYVNTEVNKAILSPVSKSVDKAYTTVGDILTYSISLSNSGNVSAINTLLIDTIPNGTTFVPNSITLNGVTQPGAVIDVPTGFNVGTIAAGQTVTVTFTVTVTTTPSPNPIPNSANASYAYVFNTATNTLQSGSNNTNIVTTQMNLADITYPTKAVDKAYTSVPSVVTYTIVMTNAGNTTANNLVFTDTIPTDTTFVPNSLTLNGVTQSGSVVAPPTGFTLGTLGPKTTATLTFQVTVNTIPSPNPIINNGTTNYTYVINPISAINGTGSGNTNSVSTQVNSADLSGISKSVDKAFATCSDILTYTITIPNSGNVTALNVIIKDTIPNGTVFVANSVTVDGSQIIGSDPLTGINVGSIPSGTVATITFQVKVQC